ncbi:MAG: O-antigen ligase family protein, partial [bacterium]
MINYSGYYPIKHYFPPPEYKGPGVGSLIGNANFLGKFLVLIMPLFIAYYFTAKNKAGKIFLGAGFTLCLCTLILTFTRASWFGFIVEIFIFAFLACRGTFRKDIKRILALMVFICIISCISFYALLLNENIKVNLFNIIEDRFSSAFDFKEGAGVAPRLFLWKKTIGIIQERPFFGFGPDTHTKAMSKFNLEYCLKFNDWGLHKKGGKKIIRFDKWSIIDRAHNNYLDITIGQGLIGLMAYLSIVVTFLVWLRRTIKQEEDIPRKIIFCGIFVSFCGCLVN